MIGVQPRDQPQVQSAIVREQPGGRRPDVTITAAKIALVGTIVAAIIGATATITAALLQRDNSAPPTSPMFPRQKVLDEAALEGDAGVKKILIADYGVPVESVDCPAEQEVETGNEFTCTVQLEGGSGEKQVDITVVDDNGRYEVGEPRDE